MRELGFISLCFILVALLPLWALWSANTLFSLGLEYSVGNWFACIGLGVFFRGLKVKK